MSIFYSIIRLLEFYNGYTLYEWKDLLNIIFFDNVKKNIEI